MEGAYLQDTAITIRTRMGPWNLIETRDLVLAKYGAEQQELVIPCMQSVRDRQWYAGYHYHEACRLLESFLSGRLKTTCLLDVVFGLDAELTDEFNTFLLEVGAHVLACVQSMHATADILAHVVYFSLGINLSSEPIAERYISLLKVKDRLRQETSVAAINALLDELASGGNFAHLSALTNVSKHRSIVRPSLSEDLTGAAPERHTLKIVSFSHSNKDYPEVVAKDFLQQEYSRSSKLVVDIGNTLNAFLRTH